MRVSWLWIFCCMFASGTTSCQSLVNNDENNTVNQVVETAPQDDIDAAIREIKQILSQTDICRSDVENPTGYCELEEVTFTPRPPSPTSVGQRILVIDVGMQETAFTRYKKRVIDIIEPDQNGNYQTTAKKVVMPKAARTILSDIIGEHFPRVSALAFQPIKGSFVQKIGSTLSLYHGETIFSVLADYNPNAEFIIAQKFIEPPDLQCIADDDVSGLIRYAQYLDNISNSLIYYIRLHRINFINLSFGHAMRNMREGRANSCIGKAWPSDQQLAKMLKLLKEHFYEPLSNLRNVTVVQASPSSDHELIFNDSEYPIDCADFSNRIRVGYFGVADSKLPPVGGEWENPQAKQILPSGQWKARRCIDIFLNSGVDDTEPFSEGTSPFRLSTYGLGGASMRLSFSTSWAAPFALSYLIYVNNTQGPFQTAQALINAATAYHLYSFQDPARHHQFETYRIGERAEYERKVFSK